MSYLTDMIFDRYYFRPMSFPTLFIHRLFSRWELEIRNTRTKNAVIVWRRNRGFSKRCCSSQILAELVNNAEINFVNQLLFVLYLIISNMSQQKNYTVSLRQLRRPDARRVSFRPLLNEAWFERTVRLRTKALGTFFVDWNDNSWKHSFIICWKSKINYFRIAE